MRQPNVGELVFGGPYGPKENTVFVDEALSEKYRRSQGYADESEVPRWRIETCDSSLRVFEGELPEPIYWKIGGWADFEFPHDKRYVSREAAVQELDTLLKGTRYEMPHQAVAELLQGRAAGNTDDLDSMFYLRIEAVFADNTGL